MRILLSYKFDKNITPLGLQCVNALARLGHEVFRMKVDNQTILENIKKRVSRLFKPDGRESLNHKILLRNIQLLKRMEEVRPDVLFIVLGYNYFPETLETIRKRFNTKIIGWWVENPNNYDMLIDTLPMYDHLFSFSKRIADEITVSYGMDCHFVNYGTDCDIYHQCALTATDRSMYGSDASFLGKYKERRYEYLNPLADIDLSVWGPLWKKELGRDNVLLKRVKGYRLFGEKTLKLFGATKVNLNINSWDIPTGPNLRVFDIPACGSFLLTEYVEELEELFELGEEIETFKSPEEMREKCLFYISHGSLREKIAGKGYEKVVGNYQMANSLARIFDIAFKGRPIPTNS